MKIVVPIVEGHGDVSALPLLLRRLAELSPPTVEMRIAQPIRVQRNLFINKKSEFDRVVQFAAAKAGDNGWMLILLDADNDCPANLGTTILSDAKAIAAHRNISVVLANREFEGWFIAAAASLNGRRGFVFNELGRPDAESIQGAKEWMGRHMEGGKYRETTDQPAFTALMDLQQTIDNSRSFRKLYKEWQANMLAET